jgi:hypothetical protein
MFTNMFRESSLLEFPVRSEYINLAIASWKKKEQPLMKKMM